MKRLITKIIQDIRRVDRQNERERVRNARPVNHAHQPHVPLGFRSRATHSYFVR